VAQMSHGDQPHCFPPVCVASEQGSDCALVDFPTAELQRAASKNTLSIALPYSKKGDEAGIIQAFHARYI